MSKINSVLEYLGDDYFKSVIDGENVICRKINDAFDIEISGLDNQKKNIKVNIYVWCHDGGLRTVEIISSVSPLETIKHTLEGLNQKYLNMRGSDVSI